MLNDLRYAVRTFAKAKGFTTAAVLVLALGVGINIALYTVVYSIFFRPLPVQVPDELVYLYWTVGKSSRPFPMPLRDFEFFRDNNDDAFAAMAGHWRVVAPFTADEETDIVTGEAVTANYFDLLGVRPALGRTFRVDEDSRASTDYAIVISHELWTRRFGGDPAVLGKKVRTGWNEERQFTIVGVMGEGFKGASDIWAPSQYWVTFAQWTDDNNNRYSVGPIARLKPGVSVAQARSIIDAQGEQLKRQWRYQENTRHLTLAVNRVRMPFEPDGSVLPMRVSATMTVVVAIVLLIAAANVAGMLIARGVGRAGEMAIRLTLGASRRRLLRQLLTESLVLSSIGGLCGLLVAVWLLTLFKRYTPQQYAVDVVLDPKVLAVTGLVCLVLGVAIGLAPALRAARTNLLAGLSRSTSGVISHNPSRLRRWIVIPQVGLSLVLLMAAGFHVRALIAIERADLGYDPRNVVVINPLLRPLPGQTKPPYPPEYAEKRAERSRGFYRLVLAGTAAIPGTGGVAIASSIPLNAPNQSGYNAVAQEAVLSGDTEGVPTARALVSPGYFRTMGIALIAGRDFDERDSRSSPRVAVINAGLARRLWPGRSAIGRTVAARNNFPASNEKLEWAEVIGVVDDVDPIIRDTSQSTHIYLSLGQEWQPTSTWIVARTPAHDLETVQRIKAAVANADALSEVFRVQTMEQMVAAILYPRRLAGAILAASGVVGLLLAAFGLHGIIAYSVVQRVHEIGIRTALGADRADVVKMILGEGVTILALGTGMGLASTYAALRVTSKFVALPPIDAFTLVSVPLVLGVVILVACYIPARRASQVDPVVALRQL
jgi:putative ABC transport system permease protein